MGLHRPVQHGCGCRVCSDTTTSAIARCNVAPALRQVGRAAAAADPSGAAGRALLPGVATRIPREADSLLRKAHDITLGLFSKPETSWSREVRTMALESHAQSCLVYGVALSSGAVVGTANPGAPAAPGGYLDRVDELFAAAQSIYEDAGNEDKVAACAYQRL